MRGQPPKGIEALLLAPTPSVPSTRGLVSKRLADHVHGFLLWMQHARARSENTVKAYGEDVRMFVAFCERSGIEGTEQVTFHMVEAFGAVLRGHLGQKETSIARRYSALRQFFLYLERHDLVAKNPAKLALTMKQPPRKPPEYMTQAERETILEVLRGRESRKGRRNYALFALMFLSGLRSGELVQLTVADVDLAGASLYVRESKGKASRRVPITPRLVRILRLWIEGWRAKSLGADSPYLFLHMWSHHKFNGQPLTTKAIWHLVKLVIEPILGRRLHPHMFRHSYATHIYEESGDLRLPQHLLGHVSIRTTAVYAHVTPRRERERLIEFLGESRAARRRAPSDDVGPTRRDATSGRWLKNTEGE
jgi:integrase/recombinase XerC